MPLDTIKTRMQSLEASKSYKNSFDCGLKIFKNEGILVFWSGAVPRLGRLILSGGIVFTMYATLQLLSLTMILRRTDLFRYEKTMEALDRLDPDRKYI